MGVNELGLERDWDDHRSPWLKFITVLIVWKWKFRLLKNGSRSFSFETCYYATQTPETFLRLVAPGRDAGAMAGLPAPTQSEEVTFIT